MFNDRKYILIAEINTLYYMLYKTIFNLLIAFLAQDFFNRKNQAMQFDFHPTMFVMQREKQAIQSLYQVTV